MNGNVDVAMQYRIHARMAVFSPSAKALPQKSTIYKKAVAFVMRTLFVSRIVFQDNMLQFFTSQLMLETFEHHWDFLKRIWPSLLING